jgi:hypothetical protein
MHARKTETVDTSCFAATASAADDGLGLTVAGHSFRAKGHERPDGRGSAVHPRSSDAVAHRHPSLHVMHMARRFPGSRAFQATESHGAGPRATSATAGPHGLANPRLATGGRAGPMPTPPQFLSMMRDVGLPPVMFPGAATAQFAAPSSASPLPSRVAWWPRQVLSSVAHRLRCLTLPREHRNALRIAQAREKVSCAAYVFLNAMQSDEPLGRHFTELKRQVSRLDKHVGVSAGISNDSTRVLREAADSAARREAVRNKILSFHREALLYDITDDEESSAEFHHADSVLLAMECRMAAGIALYGHALRGIAAMDIEEHQSGDAVVPDGDIAAAMDIVLSREAEVCGGADFARQDWLGTAVRLLPHRTMVRLHQVLSAGLPWPEPYRAFLWEVQRVVGRHVDIPQPERPERDPEHIGTPVSLGSHGGG